MMRRKRLIGLVLLAGLAACWLWPGFAVADSGDPDTPNAPSALIATVLDTRTVLLEWQDNSSNEDGFYIRRGSNPEMTADPGSFWVRPDQTTYTDSNLRSNTSYYYQVRSYVDTHLSPAIETVVIVSADAIATAVTTAAVSAVPQKTAGPAPTTPTQSQAPAATPTTTAPNTNGMAAATATATPAAPPAVEVSTDGGSGLGTPLLIVLIAAGGIGLLLVVFLGLRSRRAAN